MRSPSKIRAIEFLQPNRTTYLGENFYTRNLIEAKLSRLTVELYMIIVRMRRGITRERDRCESIFVHTVTLRPIDVPQICINCTSVRIVRDTFPYFFIAQLVSHPLNLEARDYRRGGKRGRAGYAENVNRAFNLFGW